MSTSEQIADWSAHNEGNKKEGMHKGRPKCFVATVCTLLASSPSLKMGTSYVTGGGDGGLFRPSGHRDCRVLRDF